MAEPGTVPAGMSDRRIATLLLPILLCAVVATWWLHGRTARAALLRADPDAVAGNPALRDVALARGRRVFVARCAGCHGAAGKGDAGRGVPDLTDADFLYGAGRASEIEMIVLHGIRARDSKGWNLASMPAYATPRPYAGEAIAPLSPRDIADVTALLVRLQGGATDAAAAARGRAIYAGRGGCWDCHGPDMQGDSAIGAPNLSDRILLYGGGSAGLVQTLAHGRHGTCPAFARHIDPGDARAVAIYAAALHPAARSS